MVLWVLDSFFVGCYGLFWVVVEEFYECFECVYGYCFFLRCFEMNCVAWFIGHFDIMLNMGVGFCFMVLIISFRIVSDMCSFLAAVGTKSFWIMASKR